MAALKISPNKRSQQAVANESNLWHLLSYGYIREHYNDKNINPAHIAHIIFKFLNEDWEFDYCYDYTNPAGSKHGIENNGKTIKCDCSGFCYCFYAIFSICMKPKSGKYKIKFKIDKMNNSLFGNIIGIVSSNCKNNKKLKINEDINTNSNTNNNNNNNNNNSNDNNTNNNDNNKNSKKRKCEWDNELDDYIGCSGNSQPNDTFLPNGLYCGYDIKSRKSNIFRENKFIYKSNNENYKESLTNINQGDILVLQYDSHLAKLSFSKENDGGTLDAYITNLPKDLTFHWLVGHGFGQLSVTIGSI